MSKTTAWLRLAVIFFRDLTVSVKDVVVSVIYPHRPIKAAILAMPLDVKSDGGVTLFANMITLTPGTTSLHVSEDRSTLYMHVMNVSDDTVEQTKAGFETLVLEVLP